MFFTVFNNRWNGTIFVFYFDRTNVSCPEWFVSYPDGTKICTVRIIAGTIIKYPSYCLGCSIRFCVPQNEKRIVFLKLIVKKTINKFVLKIYTKRKRSARTNRNLIVSTRVSRVFDRFRFWSVHFSAYFGYFSCREIRALCIETVFNVIMCSVQNESFVSGGLLSVLLWKIKMQDYATDSVIHNEDYISHMQSIFYVS